MIAGPDYVFACVQKTGTLAMRKWLQTHHRGVAIGPYHSYFVPANHSPGKFRFMTVRNPYDRMRSLWRNTIAKKTKWQSFEHMCRHYHEYRLGQAQIFERFRPDMVLLSDDLDKEVRRLPLLPEVGAGLLRVRVTTAPNYELTESDGVVVRELFAEDFALCRR